MQKPNLAGIAKNMRSSLSKHSPGILTGIGISGMIATTVLAVSATPKAVELIRADSRRNHDGDPHAYTKKEAVKSCWKCYIPAATTGLLSTACLIGANSVHARRNATLAAVCKLSETAFTEYREKVVETIGEKKEREVLEKVDKARIENNPVNNFEVLSTKRGNTLCYDYLSGRYFTSDIDVIKRAQNNVNEQMLCGAFGQASLNDFYNELGLEPIGIGDDLGWYVGNMIKVRISSQIAPDDRPCIVLGHEHIPTYDYDRVI